MSDTPAVAAVPTTPASESTGTHAKATSAASASASEAGAARPGRRAHIALYALQVVLGLFYAGASALPKLIAHPSAVQSFHDLGWGSGAMYTIGALELAGGIALMIPVLSAVSAVALIALMIGAFITQLTAFDGQNAATPALLVVPLALIAWARRHRTAELLRLLRFRR
ncbi:DoxX family protein [Streptomyces odontomachi]|uniref:DoxX family protein n=1 Tax=Streptomyces odontomachi TaxID=2944940 RepID=UPI00210AC7BC|nr:DoxX family protein [Streptomyces sp. ODS25]